MKSHLYTLAVIVAFGFAVFVASTAQSHGETDYFERVARSHK